MNKIIFIAFIMFSVCLWSDTQIQTNFALQSSGILNQDERATFKDHLGDIIFVEMFATT